jgi:hypothetical protein
MIERRPLGANWLRSIPAPLINIWGRPTALAMGVPIALKTFATGATQEAAVLTASLMPPKMSPKMSPCR